MALEFKPTLFTLILSIILVLEFIQNECITTQLLFHVGNEPKRKLNW